MLVAAPAAQAQSDSPGPDQYVPSTPSASGKDKKKTGSSEGSTNSGSGDDQALDRITGGSSDSGSDGNGSNDGNGSDDGKSKSKAKKSKQDDSAETTTAVAVGAGGSDDDNDDGALTSVGNALTDWNDPVLPGLVALVGLVTLGAAIAVLMRRRRTSG